MTRAAFRAGTEGADVLVFSDLDICFADDGIMACGLRKYIRSEHRGHAARLREVCHTMRAHIQVSRANSGYGSMYGESDLLCPEFWLMT